MSPITVGLAALCALLLCAAVAAWRTARRTQRELEAVRARSLVASAVLGELSHSLLLVDRDGRPLVHSDTPTWFDDGLRGEVVSRLESLRNNGLARNLRFTHRQRTYFAQVLPLSAVQEGAVAVLLHENFDADDSTAELRRLAERNDAILRSAMDGFFIVDSDCRILEVNEAFCRMTGYTEADLLQRRITDLELAPSAGEAPGVPLRTGLHHYPAAYRHRDGRTIFLENSVFVLKDGSRKILVGFSRDVTQRRREQEQLERLHNYNALLLDSVAEGIYGLDRDGRLTFINPAAARMLGWPAGELRGREMHEVLYGADRDAERCAAGDCAVCGAIRGGRNLSAASAEFRRREGGSFPVEYSATAMIERGEIVGSVVVFEDISARRQAEQERAAREAHLRQAQKLESLGLLAGGIAHDFNNILVGVLGNALLAAEQLDGDCPAQPHLQKIVNASQRASKMIQQIRAYSGRLSCDISNVDVNELIEETVDLVRAGIPKSVRIELHLAKDLDTFPADGGQVQQILMNLLINAAEAIGEKGGSIRVRTREVELSAEAIDRDFPGQGMSPGEHLEVCIRDRGEGMSPETLARAFDPFYSNKQLGRGLGLPAVRGMLSAHQGGIRLQSAPGRGTTVRFYLPRVSRVPVVEKRPADSPAVRAEATVLVIDDEADVRDVVQTVLERRGMRVLTAEDGADGLRVLMERSAEVDVVLLDMNMPGLSGLDTYREIERIGSRARVIVSSGYGQREALDRLDGRRPAIFLQKPYTIDELVEQVGSALHAPQRGHESPRRVPGAVREGA